MSTVFGRFFQRNKGNIKLAGQFAGDVVVSFCFIHTVMDYGFTGTFCVGPSMSPTLESTGEFALIDRFSYKVLGREYMKGDVVISTSKSDPNKRKNTLTGKAKIWADLFGALLFSHFLYFVVASQI